MTFWLLLLMLSFASGIVLGMLCLLALAIRKEGSIARRSQAAARRLCGVRMTSPESIFASSPPAPAPNKETVLSPPPWPQARPMPWHARSMDPTQPTPTLYEFAGGEDAFPPFAAALHARCLADPELNHPFSHADQNPQHVERLAAYLAEVLGGPPRYSGECGGDQTALVLLHAGNGDMSDLGRRFADCFMLAADDAGWPDDPRFRAALRAYIEHAVDDVALSHPLDSDVPAGLPIPRWSWSGTHRP